MDNDVKYVQLQIKAFNKALSRADKANILGGDTYATINDLIDYERMTRSGYAKAGAILQGRGSYHPHNGQHRQQQSQSPGICSCP